MDSQIADMLDLLAQEGRRHDAQETDHARRCLNLEPDTASMISTLLRAAEARRVLEIGTSNGYSTIWLAWSVQPLDGRLLSIDRSPDKHTQARKNLSDTRLLPLVELHCGDATAIVKTLPGPFDAIFFDADRLSAPAQLHELLPKLSPAALIFADNALSHPEEIAPYLQAVAALPDFDHMILPIGKGLSVAWRGHTL
jgi:predicted O-methyltransferase YrrM